MTGTGTAGGPTIPTTDADGRVLQGVDGRTLTVPPDFPQRTARHNQAVEAAEQVAKLFGGFYLPELAEFQELISPAFAVDPFLPGQPLHGQRIAVDAMTAFMKVIEEGRAAARAAGQPAAVPQPPA